MSLPADIMPLNRFDKLADETILHISEALHIDSAGFNGSLNRNIRNLSLCNRRLRRIALPLLYHTICIRHTKALSGALKMFIKYPSYAHLVKDLVLRGYGKKNNITGIEPMVSHADFEKEARNRDLPTNIVFYIKEKHPWAHSLLLLHLLQDLKTLHITTGYQQDNDLDLHLATLVKHLSPTLQVFMRSGLMFNIRPVVPLVLLPSMTKIHAYFAVSDRPLISHQDTVQGGSISSFHGTSNVETFEFLNCGLSGEDLAQLLRLPRSLKRLTYGFALEMRLDAGESLGDFKRALDYVSGSLEFLDFIWVERQFDGEIVNLWSFHNFSSLRDLRIDYSLLYGLESSPPISSITESLPNSLEVLAMRQPYGNSWTKESYLDVWKRILALKSEVVLPSLRLIADIDDFQFLRPLSDLANNKNVRIALRDEDLEGGMD
ncbi:hypothetical protein CPB86DRAFT_785384 [Serendipita vermifera]|nr:hypothetical protein CPB86DRAFT_785384 [Serendipita vermifera]